MSNTTISNWCFLVLLLFLQLQMASHMVAPLESWGPLVLRIFPLLLTLTHMWRLCLKSTSCTQIPHLSKSQFTSVLSLCEYVLCVQCRSEKGVCVQSLMRSLYRLTEKRSASLMDSIPPSFSTLFKGLSVAWADNHTKSQLEMLKINQSRIICHTLTVFHFQLELKCNLNPSYRMQILSLKGSVWK